MIVLEEGEELRRRYPGKMDKMGKGILYYTDKRVCFESDKHGMCFDMPFEKIYNFGRDKKHLFIAWLEKSNYKGKTVDARYEVKIKMDGKKINGWPLTTFEVAMSLYYAMVFHFKYGYKGVGVYKMGLGENSLRSHWYDIMWSKWDDIKKGKNKIVDSMFKYHAYRSGFEKGFIEIAIHGMDVKLPGYEGKIRDTDFKDKITGNMYWEPGDYNTLLFADVIRALEEYGARRSGKLMDAYDRPKPEPEATEENLRKEMEDYRIWIDQFNKTTGQNADKINNGEVDPDKVWTGMAARATGYGSTLVLFARKNDEITTIESVAVRTRLSRYNERIYNLVNEKINEGVIKTVHQIYAYKMALFRKLQEKYDSRDDSGIEVWVPGDVEFYTAMESRARYLRKYVDPLIEETA